MVDFLTANQARGAIERLLSKARFNMVMISPYIKITDELISRLKDAGSRNVRIELVCREGDLRPGERAKLEQIPNLVLRFNERVHAKCFYNENSMVITSLNLYESSLGDNREMGVLLSNEFEGDRTAFSDAKSEAQFIIRETHSDTSRAKPVPVDKNRTPVSRIESKPKVEYRPKKSDSNEAPLIKGISEFFGFGSDKKGHCIRCGTTIPFGPEKPYCSKCNGTWAMYGDPTYAEKICHTCGKSAKTSKSRPECRSCYKG